AIDVDDGPTPEQLAVLDVIVTHLWERSDLDLGALATFGPVETADALPEQETRRRFNQLLVVLELCRHPQSRAPVARLERDPARTSRASRSTRPRPALVGRISR